MGDFRIMHDRGSRESALVSRTRAASRPLRRAGTRTPQKVWAAMQRTASAALRRGTYPLPLCPQFRRSTLPVAVIGRLSANCTNRGYSCAASCTFTKSWISRASASLAANPGRSTIHALIASVRIGSGMPTTADSATAGCLSSVCSISDGPMR